MEPELKPSSVQEVPWTPRDVVKGTLSVVALLMVVILLVVVWVAIAFVVFQREGELGLLSAATLVATFASELVMFWAAWRWSVRKYGCSWASLGLKPFRPNLGLPLIVAVLVASFLVNAVYVLLVTALGWRSLLPSTLPEMFKSQDAALLLVAVLAVGLAPLAEEVFFRGFFFGGLQGRWGFARAAGVSALVFSLGHLQLGALVPVFILGVFLAWLYARTGSLWPCIITHMVYNGLGLLAFKMT